MNMNKKDRIYVRVTPEQKKNWEQQAKKHGFTLSGLATHCMNNCEVIFSKSHEQNVISSMKENYIINSLLQNPNLSGKAKDTIVKEIKKYV